MIVSEELIDRYFTSLNETNRAHRRELIEKLWAENGKFISPVGEVAGHSAIDGQVEGFQKQFPDAEVRQTSEIEVLYDKYVRFTFEAVQPDGETFISSGLSPTANCSSSLDFSI